MQFPILCPIQIHSGARNAAFWSGMASVGGEMGTGFHTREVRTGSKAVLQFLTLVIDAKINQMMGISFVLLCFELEKEFLWSR